MTLCRIKFTYQNPSRGFKLTILTLKKILRNQKLKAKGMAKYELTNKAVVDLNEIWEYTIENWSEN